MSTPLSGSLRYKRGSLGAGGPDPERSGISAPDDRRPRLPVTWPLIVLFVAFPVWWLLGVSAFIWPVVAIPMLAVLIWRRQSRAPIAFIFWFAFTSWVLLSGLQLQSTTKIMTFSYRLALYAAAGVLFLYVYNLPRSSRLDTRVLRILTIFWMVVVAGGYAGHPAALLHFRAALHGSAANRAAQPAIRPGTHPAGLRQRGGIPRLSGTAALGAFHLHE